MIKVLREVRDLPAQPALAAQQVRLARVVAREIKDKKVKSVLQDQRVLQDQQAPLVVMVLMELLATRVQPALGAQPARRVQLDRGVRQVIKDKKVLPELEVQQVQPARPDQLALLVLLVIKELLELKDRLVATVLMAQMVQPGLKDKKER